MWRRLSFVILFSCSLAQGKILLWDLGGVLFNPNKFGVAKDIGLSHFVSYMLFDWKNPNIQQVLFDVLEQMMPPEPGEREYAGTAEGVPLPTIMCHWQAGTEGCSGPDIIARAKPHIERLAARDFFESEREMELIQKTINAMFDPKTLAKNVYPIKQGVRLLQECIRVRNKDGSKKNRNFAFSNWDPLSFKEFKGVHNWIFSLFEDVIISGNIKKIKPRKEAYEYILEKYNLDRRECILIDDQKVNVIGAQKCGIKAILIENGDFENLRRDLVALGAL